MPVMFTRWEIKIRALDEPVDLGWGQSSSVVEVYLTGATTGGCGGKSLLKIK